MLPKLIAQTSSPIFWKDDEKTQKSEGNIVLHQRNAADWFAVNFCNEESIVIGFVKSVGIVQAWIPAFVGSLIDHEIKIDPSHGADL